MRSNNRVDLINQSYYSKMNKIIYYNNFRSTNLIYLKNSTISASPMACACYDNFKEIRESKSNKIYSSNKQKKKIIYQLNLKSLT